MPLPSEAPASEGRHGGVQTLIILAEATFTITVPGGVGPTNRHLREPRAVIVARSGSPKSTSAIGFADCVPILGLGKYLGR